MGCDIHGPYIEVLEFPSQPQAWLVRAIWETWRSYALFGALAGVRSEEINPTEPRGMPHTASWLTLDELVLAGEAFHDHYDEDSPDILAWVAVMTLIESKERKPTRIGFCFDN